MFMIFGVLWLTGRSKPLIFFLCGFFFLSDGGLTCVPFSSFAMVYQHLPTLREVIEAAYDVEDGIEEAERLYQLHQYELWRRSRLVQLRRSRSRRARARRHRVRGGAAGGICILNFCIIHVALW